MRRRRAILILLLAALPLLGCTSGGECDTCSSDSDCKEGLICSNFLKDGNIVGKRCGSGVGATTCRT